MKKVWRLFKGLTIASIGVLVLATCSKKGNPTADSPGGESTVTGVKYGEEGGFQVSDFEGQPDGPNLVFIEGGRTVLGSFEEDLMNSNDNIERTVTVASFYMDETEVANIHWLEYLFSVQKDSSEDAFKKALPDTLVWVSELAYNDPYRDHYLRYPGFRFFPVVGVNWLQAKDFCRWRTAVVNKGLADAAGIQIPEGEGRIPLETGVVLPDYRLPTEAEWEYAAQALVGTQWLDENQTQKRLYPWDGHALRNPFGNEMGYFLANFKRGRGDYAGIAGKLNDGAMITDYIYAFPPNDFGLYNMAGNVAEWVEDLYRPLSFQDIDDLNPVRRNGFLDPGSVKDPGNTMRTGYDKKDLYTPHSLVDDHVRVYKGGSWKDVAYWLSPGTRRFLEEDSSTSYVGFRCAMIRAGDNK